MTRARTRAFRSGNGEAIRLPRDVAFGEGVELVIVRSGDVMTIYPAQRSLPDMIARLGELAAPPTIKQRDVDELDDQIGL
jgi:antitoxin VapB